MPNRIFKVSAIVGAIALLSPVTAMAEPQVINSRIDINALVSNVAVASIQGRETRTSGGWGFFSSRRTTPDLIGSFTAASVIIDGNAILANTTINVSLVASGVVVTGGSAEIGVVRIRSN